MMRRMTCCFAGLAVLGMVLIGCPNLFAQGRGGGGAHDGGGGARFRGGGGDGFFGRGGSGGEIHAPTHLYGDASGLHPGGSPSVPAFRRGLPSASAPVPPNAYSLPGAHAPQYVQHSRPSPEIHGERDRDFNRDRDFDRDRDLRYGIHYPYLLGYPYYGGYYPKYYYYPYDYGYVQYDPFYRYDDGYYYGPYDYGYVGGVPYASYYNYSPMYYAYYGQTKPYYADDQGTGEDVAAADAEARDGAITDEPVARTGEEYLEDAEAAFKAGHYEDAIRLGGHAAVALHEDSRVHELLWMALFAVGDYEGAAIEAHAINRFGVTPTWANVSAQYGDPADYTTQLRTLERFVRSNHDSAFGTFLLGYEYLMLGHKDAARPLFERAVDLAPHDTIARQLLRSVAPENPAGPEKPAPEITPPVTSPDGAKPVATPPMEQRAAPRAENP